MSFCCCLNSTNENDKSFLDLPHGTEIPVKNRKQTDLPYFIILVIFFSFLVICVSVAGSRADIRRVFHGYDNKGNLCGLKNEPIEGIDGSGLDMTKEKFLKTIKHCDDPDTCLSEKLCVERCENGYALWIQPSCNMISNIELVEKLKSFLELLYWDLSLCWREILVLCFCSIFLSGLIMTALRLFVKVVIQISIILVSFLIIAWTAFTWFMVVFAIKMDNAADQSMKPSTSRVMAYWIYTSVFFTFVTIFFFLTLRKMRSKLPLICVLFKEGGKCIKDIPTMLLQPVLTHLITAVFACFLCIGVICFQTTGKAKLDEYENVYFPISAFFQIACCLLFFAFLWLSQFFLAFQNIAIAGAVSSWYFSRVKGKLTAPVWQSFCMLVKHHLGSSAFGSLVFAIIKVFKIIGKAVEERSSGNNAVAARGMTKGIAACIKYICNILNKSAYVMIVLFGEPFCTSARRAFACISSDSSKIVLIVGAGTFILSAIEFLITAIITIIGIAIFMNIEGVQLFWIPACVLFTLSYLCCHCFFSVYEMTINTLILCFCVDHQMNDGLEKPYYMNKNLMILLNEEESDSANPNADGDQNMLVVA